MLNYFKVQNIYFIWKRNGDLYAKKMELKQKTKT